VTNQPLSKIIPDYLGGPNVILKVEWNMEEKAKSQC
jgi:hypothetical protein